MIRRLRTFALRLLSLVVALAIVLGIFVFAKAQDWLSPFGIQSSSEDSQVIEAIKRTEEVSLLSLSVQGIKDKKENGTIFGKAIPGTSKTVFIQYTFDAKLGIDGRKVKIDRTGPHAYSVSIPSFVFVGYSKPAFKLATEDDGVLSFVTKDIDQLKMATDILNGSAQQKYLTSNKEILEDQAKQFYGNVIKSVDSVAVTNFDFE